MKMKVLDCALIGVLTGLAASAASAQEVPASAPEAKNGGQGDAAVECGSDVCASDEGVLMQVRSRGKREPITKDVPETSEQLQPDRRVTVETGVGGKAIAVGKWSVQLPNGGVIWATEDPSLGQPEFSVSAPSLVAFEGGRITKPVQFYTRNNYSAFIDRAEVLVYRASDSDLVSPLATVPLNVAPVTRVDWDGALPAGFEARPGDELIYVVRAYDTRGGFDETWPRSLQLVKPEEVERNLQQLRNSVEKQNGLALSVEEAQSRSLVDDVFTSNGLRLQNIPIYGSRIRLVGRNLPENASVKINGESYPVDLERKLTAEFLEPVGRHQYNISIEGPALSRPLSHTLDVDVSGRYLFAVAMADLTVSGNSTSGSVEPLGDEADRYNDSMIVDGRLAFYLKGKARGKYLITAQADTQEREVSELFNGFWDADPEDVFRRLDSDDYYPTYGDDSTTTRDVDTMGRLYLRMDWDKSQALWGNYETGLTGTEYAQYSRSLYGAALSWRSRGNNAWGDASSELKVFASEAQTAPGHSEFLGTGGSLYYLRHTDILPGSEQVVVELRDNTTGRVEKRTELASGADYQIDSLQGRIILSKTLSMVTQDGVRQITSDAPLDGYSQILLVDYEYVPTGFTPDELTAGVRGKHWFGDHLGVGLTYVDENRAGDDYTLAGADITLQAGRGTYLKVEHSRSESTSASVFYSDNGGLSFSQLNSGVDADRKGDASAIEARANFKELGWTSLDWSVGAWKRRVDDGYSVARSDVGERIEEYGAEVLGQFSPSFNFYARFSKAEQGQESLTQAQVTGEWRVTDADTFTAELRRVEEDTTTDDGIGTLAALKYLHRFGSTLDVYGIAQYTLDDDDGRYRDNDAYTLGAKYLFGDLSSISAEVMDGDRGDAATLSAEYRLTTDHSIYGSYTWTNDSTAYDPLFNSEQQQGWTLGQRWRLSNQVNMFNESQFLKEPQESGLAHTFGMDFYPAIGWNMGFTLEKASLDSSLGNVQRRAVSVSGGRTSNMTQWQSKLEWRKDSGAERREQWVTTNTLTHKFNESFRVAGRLNWSDTDDEIDPSASAKFVEGNIGFAWRPWDSTRWGLFGRYTYLYDVSTLAQDESVAYYDQRSQILSFEGVYHPSHNWEFAAKLARREGEVRLGRMTGSWADSSTTFAAMQVRYGLVVDWHAMAEYRMLDVKDGGKKLGFLAGIDRDIGKNLRIGVGYNFTDFSDDLTDFDYDHRGWFLNVVGSY